jgi:hypothetical protein
VNLSGSVAWLAGMVLSGTAASLLLTLLWLLFRIPARRSWLASVLMVGVSLAVSAPAAAGWTGFLVLTVLLALGAVVIVRFGVLAAAATWFTFYCAIGGNAPWTTSVSAWYATTAMLAIAAILAVAIYGFRTTLAGRPLWRDELQREAA